MLSRPTHQHFYNSCYSLHSCFAVSALGDDFTKTKKVIFISLYLLICNILCFTVSYLIRCVVVTARKMSLFREFPNHDKIQKQSQSHNLLFCSYETCHLHVAPRAGNLKKRLKMCRKFRKCWPLMTPVFITSIFSFYNPLDIF